MGYRVDDRLLDTPMVPVACRRCGAEVLARKSSWTQTSVQWNAQAVSRCAQRQDPKNGSPTGAPVFLGCSDLRDSIFEAASQGRVRVVYDEPGRSFERIT